jgi:hypothetical protein
MGEEQHPMPVAAELASAVDGAVAQALAMGSSQQWNDRVASEKQHERAMQAVKATDAEEMRRLWGIIGA